MAQDAYCIISETTEDRFAEVCSLDEALEIARGLAKESRVGNPISIEHHGLVIRQFVRTENGVVEEPTGCESPLLS